MSITVGKEGTKCTDTPRASYALANTSAKNYNANTFSSILCYEVYFGEIVRDFFENSKCLEAYTWGTGQFSVSELSVSVKFSIIIFGIFGRKSSITLRATL